MGAQSPNHCTTREVLELCSHTIQSALPSAASELLLLCPHHPHFTLPLSLEQIFFVVVAMLHALVFPPPE